MCSSECDHVFNCDVGLLLVSMGCMGVGIDDLIYQCRQSTVGMAAKARHLSVFSVHARVK